MMNIDFELYRVFYEVALCNNITAAAERLHISQPAVSKSIKLLESQLGGQVFVRTKRGVVLTEEGKQLFDYIRVAIEYIRNAEHQFSNMISLDSGVIKIGISRTLVKEYLLPYLEKFHKMYPKIKIEIVTSRARDLLPKLREGLIDLIIANIPMNLTSDIELIKLKEIQDVFVANSQFNIEKRKYKLDEIANMPLILQPTDNNTRDFLDDYAAKNGVYLEPEMCLASYGLVYDMTKIGYGVGYLVEDFIKDDIKNGTLKVIDVEPSIPKRSVGLLLRKNSIPSFAAKRLIDSIVN